MMKYTLSEIIQRVKREDPDYDISPTLLELMGMDSYWLLDSIWDQTQFRGYWLRNSNCTDTVVGIMVWFLKDKLVACSEQTTRKAKEQWAWVSKEAYLDVKTYLKRFLSEDEVPLIDELDKEGITLFYTLEYADQLTYKNRKAAYIKATSVKLKDVDRPRNKNGSVYPLPEGVKDHTVVVTFKNNRKLCMDIRELTFKLFVEELTNVSKI